MAEFPTERAIQCIPEFRGAASELPAFLYQCDHFAKKLPADGSHEPLVQVVLMKLRGPAAGYFKRISAETWPQMKTNLEREFGTKIKLEEIFHKIETLEQRSDESFQSYKDRALTLKEHVDEYENNADDEEKESYAIRNLRIHFLGGLKNRNLKNLAKTQKENTFEELVAYLEEECIDVEQIENIEKRLQSFHIAEKATAPGRSNYDNQANQHNRFEQPKHFNKYPRNQQQTSHFNTNFRPRVNFTNNPSRPFDGNQNGYRNANYEYRQNNNFDRNRNNFHEQNRSYNYNRNNNGNQNNNRNFQQEGNNNDNRNSNENQNYNRYYQQEADNRYNNQPMNRRFDQDQRGYGNNRNNFDQGQKN